jgi:MFS family permease
VFLLPLEREFGWTRSELTSVYSIYLLVNGFTAPLVGLTFDRLGPRWVYGCGMLSLGAAFYLAGSLTALWQFYLFIGALVGIGVSMNGMVPGSALLARWYRERLSTAMGVAYSAFGIGTVVFVPLVQYLVGEFDWRATYRIMGSALLLLAPVVILALPWKTFAAGHPARAGSRQKSGEGWTLATALRSRVFWGLVQVFFFTASAMFAIIVQLVAFFVDAGFSPLAAATAFGMVGLLSGVSVMASGLSFGPLRLPADHQPELRRHRHGNGLAAFLSFHPSVLLLVLFVPVFGLCMGMRGPIVSRWRRATSPAARGDDLRPDLCQQRDRRGARLVRRRPAARPDRRLPRGAGDVARADHGGRAAVLDRAGAAQLPLASHSSSCWIVRFASRRRWLSRLPRLETSLIAVAGAFAASAAKPPCSTRSTPGRLRSSRARNATRSPGWRARRTPCPARTSRAASRRR